MRVSRDMLGSPGHPLRVRSRARSPSPRASAGGVGEPPTRDGSGALYSDVVAALSHLAEMINQGLESGRLAVSRASPWSSADRV
jgi:hypothetical protein